ncbi:hypothetical protein M422DRAFT_49935 [Sphaerobolus stellatus SS14]|uniref:Uncharacterized protein n=1 Tax=Sphaerobolus stellatus (strain SS14) TaxID=990650 RepID=A0A0C9VAI3_SPHS4|nr:hypothetical protein M422DRAFT_49935 [Sphaerobolus stellatus SS14]
MDQDDFQSIYEFKTQAARHAAGVDRGDSTAFMLAEVFDVYKCYMDDPTNTDALKQWKTVATSFDVFKHLENKAIYSSFSEKGYHKYCFIRHVDCKNANDCMADPLLITIYLISITGFKGVVLPDDPFNVVFDKKDLTDAEYLALLEKHKDLLEKGSLRLL